MLGLVLGVFLVRFRRVCLWFSSSSFSRWVSVSFCWMVMRSSELSVFFSFSVVVSCRCISFSCVMYLLYL